MICHLLIGPPSSGKSTFVKQLSTLGSYTVISTDVIRGNLYGDDAIQGEWQAVEAEVIDQIKAAIAQNQPVIYDATNCKRAWRMDFLNKLAEFSAPPVVKRVGGGAKTSVKRQYELGTGVHWIAWYLQTPLETCLEWNQKRSSKVPSEVIEKMHQSLKSFPPIPAEGFSAVYTIHPTQFDPEVIQDKLSTFARGQVNRINRTKNQKTVFHAYSKLLDFDRLLHLISLLIRYPGLGNLPPEQLEFIFGEVPKFSDSLEEISAVIAKLKDPLYGDRQALAQDLQWLMDNRMVGEGGLTSDLDLPEIHVTPVDDMSIIAHAYSDLQPFKRLLTTIRLILLYPFRPLIIGGQLDTLARMIGDSLVSQEDYRDRLRKDIENVLKPYRIIPPFAMRHGYFTGTGILSPQELKQVFKVLQAQVKNIDDPIAVSMYETFQERLCLSKQGVEEVYPVRAIANRSMVNQKSLSQNVLAHHLELVEQLIEQGELVKLNRVAISGKSESEQQDTFSAWLLQLVFYNFTWYLGFEYADGEEKGLLCFEQLDRLSLEERSGEVRGQKTQSLYLSKLHELLEASAGIYLGANFKDQQKFLNKQKRKEAEVTVEAWFTSEVFPLVSEGLKRFPIQQVKISSSVQDGSVKESQTLFSLPKTDDSDFPHRFQLTLPKWSLEDVDFLRWIVGFGGKVKVVEPQSLLDAVVELAGSITQVYE